jgi:hypothetical protein
MKPKFLSKFIIGLYVLTVVFWVLFVISTHYTGTLEGWRFSYLLKPFLIGMTLIPLAGGVIGLRNAIRWGGRKTVMGRSMLALGLGMVAWGGGMVIWNYYLFFTSVSVPYPSLADTIFVLSWPLWTYGIIVLSKALGIRFAMRGMSKSFWLLPITVALISVYLIVFMARGGIIYDNPLKLFFDLFYPLGDIVILSVTTSVYFALHKYFGGVYKVPVLILLSGFLLNYLGDFVFAYTTTQGTYFNGHLSDFLYTTAMFMLSLSLSMITPEILDFQNAAQ